MSGTNLQPNRLGVNRPAGTLDTSPAACRERVHQLHTLTQAEYHHLLVIIQAIIPRQHCEARDALNEGLLIALRKYDGRGLLKAYVCRCAIIYAFEQMKRKRRQVNFSELESDSDFDDYLDSVLPYLEDPRYVEAVDELFIRRIEEILEGMYDYRLRFASRLAIAQATRMLALFRDNANLGKGTGIDEYEQTPPNPKGRRGQPTHNTKVVRRLITDHLSEEFQTDHRNVQSALKALRISTRQALHEGWLPV